jgi:hypothetical protein
MNFLTWQNVKNFFFKNVVWLLCVCRLTAMVVRSFARARRYIPNTVDTSMLNQAVAFLFSRQTTGTGNFYELGHVIHSEMQAGPF